MGTGCRFPPQHYVTRGFGIAFVNNSIYTEQSETEGAGWIKIAGNAAVFLDQGDLPLRAFTSADTAMHTYVNDNTRVQVVQWGSVSALATVQDLSAGVKFSPQDHYYQADILTNGTLGHQYLGEQCWYAIAQGTQQPQSRFCLRAGGPAQESLVNGRWVSTGKAN